MLKYCVHCKSVAEVTEGKCCNCGQQLTSDNNNNNKNNKYYLPEPCDVPTEQVKQLWEQTCRFMAERNLNAAGELCGQILDICPDHSDAKIVQEQIQTKFRLAGQFYETIKNGIGNQSIDQLISLLKEAIGIYPEHVDGHLVQVRLMSVTTEYKNAMQEGIKAAGVGHWQKALGHFERAGKLNPGFTAITELINFVNKVRQEVETARSNIDAALAQGNKRKAMSFAQGVDQFVEKVKNMVQRSWNFGSNEI